MRPIAGFIITVSLACAFFATCLFNPYCAAQEEQKDYFFDRLGDLMLLGRGKELYIQHIDGSGSRKLTSTPTVVELDAFFGYGGRYVVYKAEKKKSAFDKQPHYKYEYFMLPIDENDLKKKEIDEFIYRDLKKKRILEWNAME